MNDIIIRLAREEDYQELMKLYGIFTESDRFATAGNDGFKKFLDNPRNSMFVAESFGKIIGFATFSARDVVRYARPIAELEELFVLEEYRKQGIGKLLILEVEKKASAMNCQRMYLESAVERKPAHAFYESLGYEKYGVAFKKEL